MVTADEVQAQFRRLNIRPSFWSKAEIRELPKILMPGEQLKQVITGWYDGGFALLCCTDMRVLLIDKKVLFLTVEVLRYDSIFDILYQYRLLDSTVTLTCSRTLTFKSWHQQKLQQLTAYVQQRVMEVRQYDSPKTQIANMLNEKPESQKFALPNINALNQSTVATAELQGVMPVSSSTVNPYQIKPQFRRRRISRFITASQVGST